ncbi:MAG: hypothetical protein M1833_003928 [Piccolia ochrophora]|nr:MAG: hypothetical protein M1833_003928 [Piccolia ochrophora]
MSQPPSDGASKSLLLSLPPELRNDIYRRLLSADYVEARDSKSKTRRSKYSPAILGTNRQLYREASSILIDENAFVLVITNQHGLAARLYEKCRFNRIVSDHDLDNFPHSALVVNLRWEAAVEESDGPWEPEDDYLLLLRRDLDDFISAFLGLYFQGYMDIDDMFLELTLCSKTGAESMRRPTDPPTIHPDERFFLEPFRKIVGIDDVSVRGAVTPSYAEDLHSKLTSRKYTAEEIFAFALAIKAQGNAAHRAGDMKLARFKYQQAVDTIETVTMTPHVYVRSDPYVHFVPSFAMRRLQFECLSNKAHAAYTMNRLLDADNDASAAIDTAEEELWTNNLSHPGLDTHEDPPPDVFSDVDLAKAYFRRAVVLLAMGRTDEFQDDVEEVMALLGGTGPDGDEDRARLGDLLGMLVAGQGLSQEALGEVGGDGHVGCLKDAVNLL